MAGGYADQRLWNISFPNFDFGAASGAQSYYVKVPARYRARLVSIGVIPTEIFETVTTLAFVEVGTGADPDAYGKLNIATGTDVTACFTEQDDTDAIISEDIAAGATFVVKLTEGTGAGLTGQGIPFVTLELYDE